MAEIEPMRGNRAAHRSCSIHGDNGCEIQGEAGSVERAQEKRRDLDEVELCCCMTAGDLGLGYGEGISPYMVAYIHPECPIHGKYYNDGEG